jgi:DNA-binding transcriptional MerR regulator
MDEPLWTLDELIGRVAEALGDGYAGAPSARVRDLPDVRTVRWYVTRGLVDPPLAMRGRQALYGRRHLLQLVALKRRQAEGVPLATIQAELAGLPDATLATIAALPPVTTPEEPVGRAPEVSPRSAGVTASTTPPAPGRVRFWTATPAAQAAGANELHDHHELHDHDRGGGRARPGIETGPGVETVHRIRLAPGVVLLVDAVAATARPLDAAALRAAAVPLLDLLQHPWNGHRAILDQLHDPTDDEGTRR